MRSVRRVTDAVIPSEVLGIIQAIQDELSANLLLQQRATVQEPGLATVLTTKAKNGNSRQNIANMELEESVSSKCV